MSRRSHTRLDHRRVRDRSTVLLIVGVALFLPPLAGVSLIHGTVLGVPFPVFYLFVVWIALILGTAGLARALWNTRHGDGAGEGSAPGGSSPDGGAGSESVTRAGTGDA
ncbi:MAG: hypothetical protein K9H25_15085 [Rhodospirillum sp.]|nr:hypothetical protein [Rhodospirillum sp.]MCF8491039.1 hypothetical protein [Rhodospirillum sp.]MCF8500362.1 hypothetical protein [Rhodospirillum sp.]